MCNNNNNNTNQVTVISTPQFIHKLANFMHIITMHSSGAGAVKLQFYSHHTIRFRFQPKAPAVSGHILIQFWPNFKNLNPVHLY